MVSATYEAHEPIPHKHHPYMLVDEENGNVIARCQVSEGVLYRLGGCLYTTLLTSREASWTYSSLQ